MSITPDEWVQIKAKAAEAGISASDLFRASALGKKINSNIDLEAIQFLTKLSGDQGRLGGLLKLWLSERPGEGAPQIDVVAALTGIEALRLHIRQTIDRL